MCYDARMNFEVKVRKIGNSLGVVLPKEALAHLDVKEGDTLALTEAQDGLRISTANAEFMKTMEVFHSLNRRYRNALRELAK
jgi:putative addiction module antidote